MAAQGSEGFFFFFAIFSKQERKHCSPSWQTPQKVTDITAAFLSPPPPVFFFLLFFWRFRDAAARVTHGMWMQWTFVFQNIFGACFCASGVFVCEISARRLGAQPVRSRGEIAFRYFLYSANFFFSLLSTSAQLVRHNDWKSQRGCFGAECQSSSNTLETT